MIAFDLLKHEPRFFNKENYAEFPNHRIPLREMMLASAAHPYFFSEARFKDVGSFISGDSVAISPSLFAFVSAVEDKGKDPSKIRMVNVGANDVIPEPMPEDHEARKVYMKEFLKR